MGFAQTCKKWKNSYTTFQVSPLTVICAIKGASYVVCDGCRLHDYGEIGTLVRRCRPSSLVSTRLRCMVAARHEVASAWARVTFIFSSLQKGDHFKACARTRVLLVSCHYGRCSFSSFRKVNRAETLTVD